MDFDTVTADVNKILTTHFTSGRGGKGVEMVVVHYNAGNLTVEGCYSVWQSRPASAHYQVESGGRVGQLVWDRDTAWHAGDFDANQRSIGIEHANLSSTPAPTSSRRSAASTGSAAPNGWSTSSRTSTSRRRPARARSTAARRTPTSLAPSTGTTS